MRRDGLDAAVYPISWKKWEAPYPDDYRKTNPVVYGNIKSKNKKLNKPLEKTTSTVGDRVFSKKNKRTAIIIESSLERITLKFDDDGSICKYAKKLWILKTPFLPVLVTAI